MNVGDIKPISLGERLRAHLAIARLDHSIKNLFVLPGIIVPLQLLPGPAHNNLIGKLVLAFVAITLVACSNYVINEVLDAPFDRLHPIKKNRPAARGLVSIPIAYIQWLAMMVVGVAIGWVFIGHMFAFVAIILWIMGCLYNFPPIRTKDRPFVDVLTESVNNPLRMLLGWYAVSSFLVPPVSLLIAYWMIGCYFMALKRFSETQRNRRTAPSQARTARASSTTRPSVCWYRSSSTLPQPCSSSAHSSSATAWN